MMRASLTFVAAVLLSGCHILFPEDWREGVEEKDACIKRVRAEYHSGVLELLDSDEKRQPTYMFDITKMGFEDIQSITVMSEVEGEGSVTVSGFEAPAYVRNNFVDMRVDEKGAFYVGDDPALYRVRGAPIPLRDIFEEGCDRQLAGMRFISFVFDELEILNEESSESDLETENET